MMKGLLVRMLDTMGESGHGHGGLAMVTGRQGAAKALLIAETVHLVS
jgi:hypothetical protein